MASPAPQTTLTLILFGDQTYTVPQAEQRKLMDACSAASAAHPDRPLARFLSQSEEALRAEMLREAWWAREDQDQDQRRPWPRTTCLYNLWGQWRERGGPGDDAGDMRPCLPLDMALLCIYHILLFMR